MNILKSIARKILAEEIRNYESKISCLEFIKSENEKKDMEYHNLISEKAALIKDSAELNKKLLKMENIRQENEMLRKYYKADEEPSEEIRTKIFINLEVNRLKEEMRKSEIQRCEDEISRLKGEMWWSQRVYYPSMFRLW